MSVDDANLTVSTTGANTSDIIVNSVGDIQLISAVNLELRPTGNLQFFGTGAGSQRIDSGRATRTTAGAVGTGGNVTGTATVATGVAGNRVLDTTTFQGGTGSGSFYTIDEIVQALKNYGLLV